MHIYLPCDTMSSDNLQDYNELRTQNSEIYST